jgi:hypothetical protein
LSAEGFGKTSIFWFELHGPAAVGAAIQAASESIMTRLPV